ncbi:glycosyltransferase [Fulvimarina sp. MAC8]|uniref:glycosyltransferase n=1 Tax=Fulvimarina sp. MAC8 TaxID=3162874 RepID=UPI0032EFC036
MRFVLAISELSGNGPSGSRLRIAAGLAERGHEVEVLSLTRRCDREIPPSVRVTRLPGAPSVYPAHYATRLQLALKLRRWFARENDRKRIDFVSSSLTTTDRIVRMAGIEGAHHWIHIATSQVLADSRSERRRKRRARFFRNLYDGRKVIGVSQGVVDDLALLGAVPEQSRIIYNAYDIEAIRSKRADIPSDLPNGPFILHVGRFAPAKRYDVLFDAYRRSGRPEKLVLLTPPSPELQKMIADRTSESRVVVAGFRENPFPFMAAASALILSSDREGFPNVLPEALICGTPVVSTDCPAGPSEILTGPYARWLSRTGDAEALAKNLKDVLETPYETAPLVDERFTLSYALEGIEEIAASSGAPFLGKPRFFV